MTGMTIGASAAVLALLAVAAGQPGTPKVLCLLSSLLAMLLSVREFGAVLPWCLGIAVAMDSVRERFRHCWPE